MVVAAAYRGGFRETAGTAVIIAAVFLVETAIAAVGPWNTTWLASIGFELNRTILRVAYLLLTGVLLGYLAEQEKQSRAELAAIADATRQPRVDLGLGGSVAAVARMLLSTFGARAVSVVVDDHDNRRSLLWRFDRPMAVKEQPRARRVDLSAEDRSTWLFKDFGHAWQATTNHLPGAGADLRVIDPGVWPLRRLRAELPAGLLSAQPFETVTAVNMGLPGEWHGRIYLFDAQADSPERSLHFLEALTEHVTPALTNVFLLRRLRARAGAAERARVARELHDGAIQALFGIEMKLEAFRRSTDRSPSVVDREVGETQDLIRREVLSLRELMRALRPIELEGTEQLPDVLAALVERFRRDTGISARFVATGGRMALAPKKALELVRIVQEALANVRRHSHAMNVLVSLAGDNGACRLAGAGIRGHDVGVDDGARVGMALVQKPSAGHRPMGPGRSRRAPAGALAVDTRATMDPSTISNVLGTWGYPALLLLLILTGIGSPIPEDLLLLTAGYLVYVDVFGWPVALAVCIAGVVASDLMLYAAGHHLAWHSSRLAGGRLLSPQRLQRTTRWFIKNAI